MVGLKARSWKHPGLAKMIKLFSHDDRYVGQVEHRLPTGAAWEPTHEREITKK